MHINFSVEIELVYTISTVVPLDYIMLLPVYYHDKT